MSKSKKPAAKARPRKAAPRKAAVPAVAEEPKRGRGRPPKLTADERTISIIEGLARIQCTKEEAAAVLKVCEDTFEKFLGDHEKAAEAWASGRPNGKASLRRMQFEAARKGNTTMMIWLGKQYLGQRDRNEHSGKIEGGGVVSLVVSPAEAAL